MWLRARLWGRPSMEITTLIYAALAALGLLAVDATVMSGSVVINVSGPPQTEKTRVDQAALRALVAGVGRSREFGEILTQNKDEPLMDFVGRSSLVGVSELALYSTAIYLLQAHSA